jgi:hypothetical protein
MGPHVRSFFPKPSPRLSWKPPAITPSPAHSARRYCLQETDHKYPGSPLSSSLFPRSRTRRQAAHLVIGVCRHRRHSSLNSAHQGSPLLLSFPPWVILCSGAIPWQALPLSRAAGRHPRRNPNQTTPRRNSGGVFRPIQDTSSSTFSPSTSPWCPAHRPLLTQRCGPPEPRRRSHPEPHHVAGEQSLAPVSFSPSDLITTVRSGLFGQD